MFRPKNPAYKEVWHTASLYHLVHTAALLGAPITKCPNIVSVAVLVPFSSRFAVTLVLVIHTHCADRIFVLQFGGLLTAGIVFFSGTSAKQVKGPCFLYDASFTRQESDASPSVVFHTTSSVCNVTSDCEKHIVP
ncbi:hypothetical protein BAE44_0007705 [Dichanthelium oligosanthes]|uniref:Uncharacterized protein n=1 Tax=Dichanthelium oligosanthes TaxID=888268 RepID=A0A1E5W1K8_9POAL|nr:hypothetical protein BAE44_0007705 [Dichanthelium oligosanthes]